MFGRIDGQTDTEVLAIQLGYVVDQIQIVSGPASRAIGWDAPYARSKIVHFLRRFSRRLSSVADYIARFPVSSLVVSLSCPSAALSSCLHFFNSPISLLSLLNSKLLVSSASLMNWMALVWFERVPCLLCLLLRWTLALWKWLLFPLPTPVTTAQCSVCVYIVVCPPCLIIARDLSLLVGKLCLSYVGAVNSAVRLY